MITAGSGGVNQGELCPERALTIFRAILAGRAVEEIRVEGLLRELASLHFF